MASLPWLHWKAAAQSSLSQAQAAEREVSLLRNRLAALGTTLAEAGERTEKTAAKLLATQDLLADRDAALALAHCEAAEREAALKRVNCDLAASRSELAACKDGLAGAGAQADETVAELQSIQIVLAERDAALARARCEALELKRTLEGANSELADFRKELGAFKAVPRDPIKRGGHPRESEIKPDENKEEKIQKRSSTEVMALSENNIWQLYIEDDFSLSSSRSPPQRIAERLN